MNRMMGLGADQKGFGGHRTHRCQGIDVDSLVDVAQRPPAELEGVVATATKRSPRFCGAQLDPSHGTGAWALQEL